LLLEQCGGRWRVHQSFVRQGTGKTPTDRQKLGSLPPEGTPARGYTAAQWSCARACDATRDNEVDFD